MFGLYYLILQIVANRVDSGLLNGCCLFIGGCLFSSGCIARCGALAYSVPEHLLLQIPSFVINPDRHKNRELFCECK